MKQIVNFFMLLILLACVNVSQGQTTVTIGTGTSSYYYYGPIYRSSASSSFDFSRYNYLYTASELLAAGITNGATISSIQWNKYDAFGTVGGAKFYIYVKNSAST